MNKKEFTNYIKAKGCGDISDILFKKIDADINREFRENSEDFEKILEEKFLDELVVVK